MNTFVELKNRYVMNGMLQADEGLHIGTGIPSVDTDAPVIRELGQPFVPGSSLRGAMRSCVERMVWTLWGSGACCSLFNAPAAGNNCWAGDERKRKPIEQGTQEGERLRKQLTEGSGKLCIVCRFFGSTIMAARFKTGDARLTKPQEPSRRDGVGIDRDTETAAEKIKYDFEVLDRGCEFRFQMQVENAESSDLALLYLLIKEMEHGLDVGGKKARGLGRVRLVSYNVEYFDDTWSLSKYLAEGMAKAEKAAFEPRIKDAFDKLVQCGGPTGRPRDGA